MEESSKIVQYFWTLVEQLPSVLAMIGCLIFALTRWKRHPKVSLMVVAGLGLLLIHVVAFLLIYDLVPPIFIKSTDSYEASEPTRQTVRLVLGLISHSMMAIAFILLLAGIFIQRPEVNESPTG